MSVDSHSSSSHVSLLEQLTQGGSPIKLYNREGDFKKLLNAYKKRNLRHLVLSVGPVGVGKTALIERLRPRVERDGGFFVQSRFDDLDHPEPFAAWIDSAEQLIEQLIDRCDEVELATIMKALNQCMEVSDLHALATLIPLLGDLMNLTPQPTTGRFQFLIAFGGFLRAVTHPNRPIVWFLDHVHASDASSLEVLKLLLVDRRIPNILPILAFRPVPPHHPTSIFLQSLEASNVPMVPIIPTPIDEMNLMEWLDSYRMGLTVEQRAQICTTIAEGLDGNALAIHLCLQIMNWNREIVQATGGTPLQAGEDCTSLFRLLFQMLSIESQQVCRVVACMGTKVDLPHLAEIVPNCDIPNALAEAERRDILRFCYHTKDTSEQKPSGDLHDLHLGYYEFTIPTYRELLYATLTPEQRQLQHTAIAAIFRQDQVDIFRIVVHMALAGDQLAPKAKELLVGLCVDAGRQATHCGELVLAAKYYQLGISLLVDCRSKFWSTQPSLIVNLYCDTAEVAGLLGKYTEMDALIEEAMTRAKDSSHRFQATQVQLKALMVQQNYSEVLVVGLKALPKNGEHVKKNWDSEFKIVRKLLQSDGEESLAFHRPLMTDSKTLGVMQVMNLLVSPALLLQDELVPQLACRMVKHTFQHGLSISSPLAMCLLGVVLCLQGDIELGVRCSDIGMEWVETISDKSYKGRVMTIHWGLLSRFVKPWKICQEPLKLAYRLCIQGGDSEFALICPVLSILNMMAAGGALCPISQAMKSVYQMLQRKNHDSLQRLIRPFYQLVLNLMGISPEVDTSVLTGTIMNEDDEWRYVKEHSNPILECCLLWCQAVLAFSLHKFVKARDLLERCRMVYLKVPHLMLGSFQISIEFWNAMTAVRLLWKYQQLDILSATDKRRQTELEVSAKASLTTLEALAKHSPDNVNPKVLLIQGELQALQGHHDECVDLFQRAIESAEEGLFEKAVIGEQAGLTLRLCGKDDLALDYLEDCCASYRAWGALIKVDHVKGTVIPEAIYQWEE